MWEFKVKSKLSKGGRTGVLTTPHGAIHTPVFMPVGTNASVRSLSPEDLDSIGAQIILANNYHLFLNPGSVNIAQLGGIHKFMGWNKPILTDSGGFQVWSLGQRRGLNPIRFAQKTFSPETATQSQIKIGADIIMALDICTPDKSSHQEAQKLLAVTHDWLVRCQTEWKKHRTTQALFGIIQGALHKDLRQAAAKFVSELDLPGIAIGGETIGYNMTGTEQVMNWIMDLLPPDKPRYTMGVGLRPSDLTRAVAAGADMFDCVAPTRLARNGALYVSKDISPTERIDINKAIYKLDPDPVDPNCDCPTCQKYSKAYLHHLFKSQELLYYRLASLHNLRVMIRTVAELN